MLEELEGFLGDGFGTGFVGVDVVGEPFGVVGEGGVHVEGEDAGEGGGIGDPGVEGFEVGAAVEVLAGEEGGEGVPDDDEGGFAGGGEGVDEVTVFEDEFLFGVGAPVGDVVDAEVADDDVGFVGEGFFVLGVFVEFVLGSVDAGAGVAEAADFEDG